MVRAGLDQAASGPTRSGPRTDSENERPLESKQTERTEEPGRGAPSGWVGRLPPSGALAEDRGEGGTGPHDPADRTERDLRRELSH